MGDLEERDGMRPGLASGPGAWLPPMQDKCLQWERFTVGSRGPLKIKCLDLGTEGFAQASGLGAGGGARLRSHRLRTASVRARPALCKDISGPFQWR